MITSDPDAFRAALPHGPARLAGLDLGTRTIGLATSDAEWRFATARLTIRRTRLAADLAELGQLVTAEQIAGLVLGLPLNMDGSAGPRAQATRAFAREASARFGLPMLLWDERWSTVAVERAMIEADMSRARRAERIDAHAAAHILQGALDRLAYAPPPALD